MKSYLGKHNTFTSVRKCFVKEQLVTLGYAILLQTNTFFIYFFPKDRKVAQRNTIVLQMITNVLKKTKIFEGLQYLCKKNSIETYFFPPTLYYFNQQGKVFFFFLGKCKRFARQCKSFETFFFLPLISFFTTTIFCWGFLFLLINFRFK